MGLIGSGGMGHVYKARDTRLDRCVAIKTVSDRFSARFEREARAVAALNHPNVCTLYDIGPNYLVMEFVEGESLAAHLRDGPLEEDAVLRYGIQIAEALGVAHAKGIVHRDLKPENVLITPDDRVKLMDFGLALMLPQSAPSDPTVTHEPLVTQPGTVLGTFPYMSPEQVRGENAEPTSDIFSLGSLLYEAICGRPAFARSSAAETMAAILKDEPGQFDGEPELDRIIRRCLAKDAKQRFQTAREVGAALAHARAAPKPQIGRRPTDFDSLAVLPFVNVAGDEDTEYLCEGIAETLINHLSQVSSVRVVARTTAFRYRGEPDVQKTARELKVSAVLSGKLVKRGNALKVQVELVDPGTATQLWGHKYHRKLTDIFVVEEEIAREIVAALQLKLVPGTSDRVSRRSTDNVEAYQLCLKGRFFWNKRTREALDRAIACYRDAIELEPTYAVAYAGLADCYNVLGSFAVMPPGDVFPRARAAARRALEIEEDLVAARVALASVSAWYDRDYAVSDREFLQAITTDPHYPEARQWYGLHLCVRGRFDEGIRELLRAQELDPLSPMLNVQLASGYYFARRYEEAAEILRKTIDLDRNFGPAHWFLGRVYGQQRIVDRAVAELQMAVDATGRGTVFLATLGWGLGAAGRIKDAEQVLDELRSRSVQEYVSSICLALVHVGLGDRLATVERLREALAERSAFATWIKVDPIFDTLRGDPEFEALLHSLN
jgi:TolB-like protein/Tfp pilus assembly protein PilF/predicted Ser/Thr protein kinase